MTKTASTVAQELLPQNQLRRSFVIQNEDGAINIYVKKERPGFNTVSATDHDHRISPGGGLALNFNNDGEEAIQERWTVIAASGTPTVSYFETEDITR